MKNSTNRDTLSKARAQSSKAARSRSIVLPCILSFALGALIAHRGSIPAPSGPGGAQSSAKTSDEASVLTVADDDKNAGDTPLPNHVAVYKFQAHVEALNGAIVPGRGYQPSKERYNTRLPEGKGSYWWVNNCEREKIFPEAFGIAALNMTYPRSYFSGAGHPSPRGFSTDQYIKYINRYSSLYLGRDVKSLVEFGNGGGVFAQTFHKMYGKEFMTVEGSGDGCQITIERGVPKEQVVQHDLRHPIFLGRRFDVAICTEVVEHVEPPFSGQIILSLVLHADVIWFSFKRVGFQNGAWINHPNERPFEFWRNLFDFYGYEVARFDDRVTKNTYYRGDFIAYRRNNAGLHPMTAKDLLDHTDKKDLLGPPK